MFGNKRGGYQLIRSLGQESEIKLLLHTKKKITKIYSTGEQDRDPGNSAAIVRAHCI